MPSSVSQATSPAHCPAARIEGGNSPVSDNFGASSPLSVETQDVAPGASPVTVGLEEQPGSVLDITAGGEGCAEERSLEEGVCTAESIGGSPSAGPGSGRPGPPSSPGNQSSDQARPGSPRAGGLAPVHGDGSLSSGPTGRAESPPPVLPGQPAPCPTGRPAGTDTKSGAAAIAEQDRRDASDVDQVLHSGHPGPVPHPEASAKEEQSSGPPPASPDRSGLGGPTPDHARPNEQADNESGRVGRDPAADPGVGGVGAGAGPLEGGRAGDNVTTVLDGGAVASSRMFFPVAPLWQWLSPVLGTAVYGFWRSLGFVFRSWSYGSSRRKSSDRHPSRTDHQ